MQGTDLNTELQAPLAVPDLTAVDLIAASTDVVERISVASLSGAGSTLEEHAFLDQLAQLASSRGLFYERDDLIHFHVSVKTNLLTILGGMSGTGKSQLALLYGQALGLEYGNSLKLIPISPSYHEPSDILGYYNPSSNLYHGVQPDSSACCSRRSSSRIGFIWLFLTR